MEPPAPTPYDITDIPHFAWEPGIIAWLILAGSLVAFAVRTFALAGAFKNRRGSKVVNTLFMDLIATSKSSEQVSIERAARLGRRLASHLSTINLAELSCDELKAYPTEDLPHSLRDAIHSLALLEELGYSPPSSERDIAARAAVAKLTSQLSEYRLLTRAR
jgi:hypothetical protein